MLPNSKHVLVIYSLVRKSSLTIINRAEACYPGVEAGEQQADPSYASYAVHSTFLSGTEHHQLPTAPGFRRALWQEGEPVWAGVSKERHR